MRQVAVGCVSAIIGLIVGVILMLGATQVLSKTDTPNIPAPIPSSSRTDVSITPSAAFVNSQLSQAVRQSGLAKQATIALDAPNVVQVTATIETSILGQRVSVNATARMRVSVKGGRILLAVEKVDTGNTLIPQSLIAPTVENLRVQAENQINLLVQRSLQGTSLRVTNVRITPNDVTVDLVSQ